MTAIPVDTHYSVKKLQAKDIIKEQAEAIVEVVCKIRADNVSKHEARQFKSELKHDIGLLDQKSEDNSRSIKWMVSTVGVGTIALLAKAFL